jgi:hypothetical protein
MSTTHGATICAYAMQDLIWVRPGYESARATLPPSYADQRSILADEWGPLPDQSRYRAATGPRFGAADGGRAMMSSLRVDSSPECAPPKRSSFAPGLCKASRDACRAASAGVKTRRGWRRLSGGPKMIRNRAGWLLLPIASIVALGCDKSSSDRPSAAGSASASAAASTATALSAAASVSAHKSRAMVGRHGGVAAEKGQ